MNSRFSSMLAALLMFLPSGLQAQEKRPMQVDDCLQWRTVSGATLSKNGQWVAYSYRQLHGNGADTLRLYDVRRHTTLVKPGVQGADFLDDGHYMRLTRREADGKRTTWLLDLQTQREEDYEQSAYAHRQQQKPSAPTGSTNTGWQAADHFDMTTIKGLPAGVKPSALSRLINGGRQVLVYPQAPAAKPGHKDSVQSTVELWKWDEPLSPRRRARLYPGFKEGDKYVYDIATKQLTLLPTRGMASVYVPSTDTIHGLLATDERPWQKETDWVLQGNNDLYYITLDGQARQLVSHERVFPEFSPDGCYALFYSPNDRAWKSVDMLTGTVLDLTTGKIPFAVYDETSDFPYAPAAYGKWQWRGGRQVVVMDRYDFWLLTLDGSQEPVCLTKGYGRTHAIRLKPSGTGLTGEGLTWLDGLDERTKTVGLYVFDGKEVRPMAVDSACSLVLAGVSADRKTALWQRNSFGEHDYWLSDLQLKKRLRRVTDVDANVAGIRRGTAQLYTWPLPNGRQGEGILYLPEGYKKGQPLPLVVTFYEHVVNDLHQYVAPGYSSTTIDIPWYVSNGYAVFEPDLTFTVGAPGESCLQTVVSGVERLVADGYVRRDRVGVNGHSWGGYLTNYLVTHTDLFRCASPCAAVSNCVSDYLMLRGTGQPNMYFEENAQGRLGKSLWEDKQLYIDASPVFDADCVRTPLLIMQGEEDVCVREDQGLGMFFAMRRLGKPAWLLRYLKEGHQLVQPENCRDFSVRLAEFFGHYLKDEPLPEWMKPVYVSKTQ